MTSMAKITMAISRNTVDFIRRTKFAQEKTDDSLRSLRWPPGGAVF
jgi:hypothetical protein